MRFLIKTWILHPLEKKDLEALGSPSYAHGNKREEWEEAGLWGGHPFLSFPQSPPGQDHLDGSYLPPTGICMRSPFNE